MKTLKEKIAAASDPSTPAEVLEVLAVSKNQRVRLAAGRNPNTPEDSLRGIWIDHPECVLENPVLALWEFTGGGTFPERLGLNTLLILYNHLRASARPLPAQVFRMDILRKLVSYGVSDREASIFQFMPFEENSDLRALMLDNAQYRGMFPFWDEHAPDAVWERLATDNDPRVRLSLAALLRSCPEHCRPRRAGCASAARLLLGDSRPEVCAHLVRFRYLPADVATVFARSPEVETREAVAGCFLADAKTLEKLAGDPEEGVRLAVATHCQLPEIHKVLLRDPSAKVRRRLAENRSVSLETLECFDPRDAVEVVQAVFTARHADSRLRERLLIAGDHAVQKIVPKLGSDYTPAFHGRVKALLLPETLVSLAEAPRMPSPVVEDLAFNPDPLVRLAVAGRLCNSHNTGSTPRNLDLLRRFASDPDFRVRLCVCTDRRLDRGSALALFRDPDSRVRKKCVRSVLGGLESCIRYRNHGYYRALYQENSALLITMAGDPDASVRLAIAHSSEAPPAALGVLFDDPVGEIRAVVRNKRRWPYGILLGLEKCHRNRLRGRPLAHGITTPGAGGLHILARSRNPFSRMLAARCLRTAKADLKILAGDPHPAIREIARARLLK